MKDTVFLTVSFTHTFIHASIPLFNKSTRCCF
ncbi:hypothetical protein DUD79_28690 [Priestia aryabhattai]